MKRSLWVTNLGFIPRSPDLAVLFLRIALGLSMMILHGWQKLIQFPVMVENFPDPLGMGRYLSLIVAMVVEIGASALLIAGVLTRFAAALLLITMAVALFRVHDGNFFDPGAETAALYLFGYVVLILTGGGRFSADATHGPVSLAVGAAVVGGVLGYPVSYLFQGSAYRTTVTMNEYLGGIRTVLRQEDTAVTAMVVWGIVVIIMAVIGYFIGRAMNRRTFIAEPVPEPVVVERREDL